MNANVGSTHWTWSDNPSRRPERQALATCHLLARYADNSDMRILRSPSLSPTRAVRTIALLACIALALPSVAFAAWRLLETTPEPGTTLSGGDYRLQLVVGQPDAGAASAGALTLESGFVRAAVQRADALFSDGFESIEDLL